MNFICLNFIFRFCLPAWSLISSAIRGLLVVRLNDVSHHTKSPRVGIHKMKCGWLNHPIGKRNKKKTPLEDVIAKV